MHNHYLHPSGATLWVGNDPDIIGPDLHVVDGLCHMGELLVHVDVARNGLYHGVLYAPFSLEELCSGAKIARRGENAYRNMKKVTEQFA